MKNIKIFTCILCLSFIGISNINYAQNDSVTIRIQLQKGQTFPLKSDNNMSIEMTIADSTMSMDMNMGQVFEYTVNDVDDDGNMTLDATVKRVLISMQMMNGIEMAYDSDTPQSEDEEEIDIMSATYSKMIGTKMSTKFSPTGEILDFSGMEDFMQETLGEDLNPTLQKSYGNDAMKELMKQMSSYLPQHPVTIGDSWDMEITWSGMTINYTYTLKSIKKDIYILDIKGDMNMDLGKMMGEMTQMPEDMGIEYHMSGDLSGYMHINKTDGWIQEMVHYMNVSGEMRMKMPEDAPANETENIQLNDDGQMVIPMKMKMEQKMSRM